MIRLSTRAKYAVRALLDLVLNSKDKPIFIKDIANRIGVSESYLENIFHKLQKAGILKSRKGKGGGFLLAKNPKNINVYEIIKISEGELLLSKCLSNKYSCDKEEFCITRELWGDASLLIKKYLSSVTIEDLKVRYLKKMKQHPDKNLQDIFKGICI